MQMSPAGRHALIETFEGLRTLAYRDATGIWTIGFGHTSVCGLPTVCQGMKIASDVADQLLAHDLARFEIAVTRMLKRVATQNQFDALVDFAYNCGPGNLASSNLLRFFNQGRPELAAGQFGIWTRAGGRILQGLVRRRQAEKEWFLENRTTQLFAIEDPVHKIDNPHPITTRIVNRIVQVAS